MSISLLVVAVGVQLDARRDVVNVLLDILGYVVLFAPHILYARLDVLVDMVVGEEELLNRLDIGIEREPLYPCQRFVVRRCHITTCSSLLPACWLSVRCPLQEYPRTPATPGQPEHSTPGEQRDR